MLFRKTPGKVMPIVRCAVMSELETVPFRKIKIAPVHSGA
jgi:hypothetical protein